MSSTVMRVMTGNLLSRTSTKDKESNKDSELITPINSSGNNSNRNSIEFKNRNKSPVRVHGILIKLVLCSFIPSFHPSSLFKV